MKEDRRLSLIRQDRDFAFYLYRPSLLHMYYDDGRQADWPSHQTALGHRLHMALYLMTGGCRILYMTKDGEVISYLVISRGGSTVVRGTTREDIYTVFVWSYPEYRCKGYGKRIVQELLGGGIVDYRRAYKTIVASNTASVKAALATGYKRICSVKRTAVFHTAYRAENEDYHLYMYERS